MGDIIRHYRGQGPHGWKVEIAGRVFEHNERVYCPTHKRVGYVDLRETDNKRLMVRWERVDFANRGGAWVSPDAIWTKAELDLVESTKGI